MLSLVNMQAQEMKKKNKEITGFYKNYMALKIVIKGRDYLSDDGILIEVERHSGNRGGLREEETA